jgi:microcompartment protein CcmL/EutN
MNPFKIEKNALGMVEWNSISQGIFAADAMLKVSEVELIYANSICPGKYICVVRGDVASVRSSVEAGKQASPVFVVDEMVIPNLHPTVFPAINAITHSEKVNAIGVIETYSAASALLAADRAAKTAEVLLLLVRLATGLGGKSYVVLTGEVAAVRNAVDAGAMTAQEKGLLVGKTVVPQPEPRLFEKLN